MYGRGSEYLFNTVFRDRIVILSYGPLIEDDLVGGMAAVCLLAVVILSCGVQTFHAFQLAEEVQQLLQPESKSIQAIKKKIQGSILQF